jgi:hypothetical protein
VERRRGLIGGLVATTASARDPLGRALIFRLVDEQLEREAMA